MVPKEAAKQAQSRTKESPAGTEPPTCHLQHAWLQQIPRSHQAKLEYSTTGNLSQGMQSKKLIVVMTKVVVSMKVPINIHIQWIWILHCFHVQQQLLQQQQLWNYQN